MSAGSYGVSVYEAAGVTADDDLAVAANKGLFLLGYSIKESAGSPAVATGNIVHGVDVATGQKVVYVELAANASDTKWFGDTGIYCPAGLTIDHVAGTFDIILYYRVAP